MLAAACIVLLGAVPVPTGGGSAKAREKSPIRIYVLSNGFHSDIAIPDAGGDALLRLRLSAADFPVDAGAVQFWSIGWGSRTAYTSLREVRDLTPAIIVRALALDETVMHVQPLGAIAPQKGVYAYDLAPSDYERLIEGIGRSFKRDRRPVAGITQGFGDRFYSGNGRFSPLKGCNVWTGQRLREAGVGVGLWTAFAQTLEFGLARTALPQPSDL